MNGVYIDKKSNFFSRTSFVNKKMASLLDVIYSLSKILLKQTIIIIIAVSLYYISNV